ncbi:MAG: hypothetical protein H6585_04950 [Flavobacteriales bacterium]|nr:hypothetical protein [Flavobacteriales bacterium]MCB9447676.1 hypothetical protein [Flavobacteriales bacterium]
MKDEKAQQESFVRSNIRRGLRNRQLYVFLSCVLLSTIFWLLITLSESSSARISTRLVYTGLPSDKVLVDSLPLRATVKVSGNGFDLLGLRIREPGLQLQVNVAKLRLRMKNDKEYYILPNQKLSYFSDQWNRNIRMTDIDPDSILFRFDERTSRKVPVVLDTRMTFRKQFQMKDTPMLTPDSVTISGPAVLVKQVERVFTQPVEADDVHEDFSGTLTLVKDSVTRMCDLSHDRIKVQIPVESFTEDTRMVPVHVVNLPDSVRLRIFPEEVKVIYNVGLSHFDEVKSGDFFAEIDVAGVMLTQVRTLKVTLSRAPSYLSSIRLEPQKVEFLIRK